MVAPVVGAIADPGGLAGDDDDGSLCTGVDVGVIIIGPPKGDACAAAACGATAAAGPPKGAAPAAAVGKALCVGTFFEGSIPALSINCLNFENGDVDASGVGPPVATAV